MKKSGCLIFRIFLVILFFAILAALLVPTKSSPPRAQIVYTEYTLYLIATALETYCNDSGIYPPESPPNYGFANTAKTLMDADILTIEPSDIDKQGNPLDAWGTPILYRTTELPPGVSFGFWSCGTNNQDEQGAGDDISSWRLKP